MGELVPIDPSRVVLSGEISGREARNRARAARKGIARPIPQPVVRPVAPPRPRYEPSVAARLPLILGRLAWRFRWQLGVLGAVALVAYAGVRQPLATALTLAALGGLAYWWSRTRSRVLGRMWLSARERTRAAWWAGAGSAWAGVAIVAPPPFGGAWWLLVAVVAVPSWQLAASRPPKGGTPRASSWARDVLRRWPEVTSAPGGPVALAGSTLDPTSLRTPNDGTMTVTVHLAHGRHGRDTVDAMTRRYLEAALDLPVDTVQLAVERDHARRAVLTITRGRTLETTSATWPGPVLTEDGAIPIAMTDAGQAVSVRLFNDEGGVEHVSLSGTSGVGKSSTLAALVLPGVLEGKVALWYVDGKGGGSAPYLRPACDWYARDRDSWLAVIEAAHAVMEHRERDRGNRDLYQWRGQSEEDPILRVVVDEGATIERAAGPRTVRQWTELAEKGRSLGIALVHSGQSARAEHIMGGAHVRDQITGNGSVIAHRAAGGSQSRLALDSAGRASIDVDLTELPPGAGWAVIVRKGEILSERARVLFADGDAAGEHAERCSPRALTGGDADAAGAAYAARHDAPAAPGSDGSASSSWQDLAAATAPTEGEVTSYGPAVTVGAPPATTVVATRSASRTDRVVLEQLQRLSGAERTPVARRDIVAATGLGASTVARSLTRMREDGTVCREDGQRWLPGRET